MHKGVSSHLKVTEVLIIKVLQQVKEKQGAITKKEWRTTSINKQKSRKKGVIDTISLSSLVPLINEKEIKNPRS